MTADYEITGRNGALKNFRIFGDAETIAEIASVLNTGYPVVVSETEITGKAANAGIDHVDRIVSGIQRAAASTSKTHRNREIVRAGTVSVGDVVNGAVVTGLGVSWYPVDHSAIGVPPYWDEVQYVYFS